MLRIFYDRSLPPAINWVTPKAKWIATCPTSETLDSIVASDRQCNGRG
jgi:hypothetical protein